MKWLRYQTSGESAWGLLEEEQVFRIVGSPFARWERGEAVGRVAELALLPPVAPSKVICIGRNYAAHAAELGNEVPSEPLIFLKAPSSVIGPGASIRLTPQSQQVEHEGELVLVIGRRCRNLSEAEALGALLGFTCGNDVTARDIQRREDQWGRAKNFDTFAPLGPWIVTPDEFDAAGATIRCTVNGALRQQGALERLIFPLPRLLAEISAVMTLEPGDVIMSGTPAGVGPLRAGDVVEVSIEGIGTLRNPVVAG